MRLLTLLPHHLCTRTQKKVNVTLDLMDNIDYTKERICQVREKMNSESECDGSLRSDE